MVVDILCVVLIGVLLFRNERVGRKANAFRMRIEHTLMLVPPPVEIVEVERLVEVQKEVPVNELVEKLVKRLVGELDREPVIVDRPAEELIKEPSRVVRRREYDLEKPFEILTSSESLTFETIKEAKAMRAELVATGEKTELYTWGRWRGVE